MKATAVKFTLQLTDATRAEIIMRVVEEPNLPTPSEPEVIRVPWVTEWADIVSRLQTLDRLEMKRSPWPGEAARAEAIATAILTGYNAPEATRVQLMLKQPDGSERNLGGRCKDSLVETIAKHLP